MQPFNPARLRALGRIAVLAGTLLVAGCGEDSEPGGVTKAEPGKVPAAPQRPGDPELGYDALVNRSVLTCGLPYSAYRATAGGEGPVHELPGRSGRNAELPYMLTAFTADSGVELVTSNCLSCHAAPLDGELIIGLGNEFLDFTRDPIVAVEGAGAYVEGEAEAAEWRKWADRIALMSPYQMTDTVGVNPAVTLTLGLMAHRDPETLAWSEEPLIEPPPGGPVPVSVPPWWNMRKKHASFYNAMGRGDLVGHLMLASTVCTDSVEEAEEIDAWFVHVRAFLAQLEPPAYPYEIDGALAEEGRELFEDNCKRCHGTYGEEGRYPNRVVALDKVGTDPVIAEGAYRETDRFLRWFARSFYGKRGRAVPSLGYIAPPLDGVWATAPYLHNGSVPTLAALLDTTRRPGFWRFDGDQPDYDPVAVGWEHRVTDHGKAGAMSWDERARIYDTTLPGYSNAGHDFGDEFSDPERMAVIEYLKTL
jgi:mono/diheme cytochrome c family protein